MFSVSLSMSLQPASESTHSGGQYYMSSCSDYDKGLPLMPILPLSALEGSLFWSYGSQRDLCKRITQKGRVVNAWEVPLNQNKLGANGHVTPASLPSGRNSGMHWLFRDPPKSKPLCLKQKHASYQLSLMFWFSFPTSSFLLPGITFQINYMHTNSWIRFWFARKKNQGSVWKRQKLRRSEIRETLQQRSFVY